MMMNCLIVDDEPIAREGIKKFVDRLDFLVFVDFAKDVETTIKALNEFEIDILFIDIEMPGISGIEFVKTYEKKLPLIVFITAYHDYAVESYSLHVVDYLLKPVSFDRFEDCANRAFAIHQNKKSPEEIKPTFFLRYEGQYQKVVSDELVYISAMQNYTRLHFKNGDSMIVHYTLKNIHSYLDPEVFIPVHKSYIVSLNFIESVSSTTITLSGQGQVPIGRSYRALIMPKLLK